MKKIFTVDLKRKCPICLKDIPLENISPVCSLCSSQIKYINEYLSASGYKEKFTIEKAIQMKEIFKCNDILTWVRNPLFYYHLLTTLSDVDEEQANKSKSDGERKVEEYLKEHNFPYLTQYDTLKCINPITNRQLPYDFEIPYLNLLIEVQGEQHFKEIKYFHENNSSYRNQILRDKIKMNFAVSKEYEILYITNEDITSGIYKDKIEEAIKKQYTKFM